MLGAGEGNVAAPFTGPRGAGCWVLGAGEGNVAAPFTGPVKRGYSGMGDPEKIVPGGSQALKRAIWKRLQDSDF